MEEGSSIDNDVTCLNNTLLHLGAWSAVSQQSFLCTAGRDIDRPGRPATGAPIYIGPGAWVAVQCFVGPGVTIGAHAVVGARSTITRDVAAMSVVAGSPPRLLRMRTAASVQR
jgi:putative colanic acid biosynthesis acetyltransferase WcaF